MLTFIFNTTAQNCFGKEAVSNLCLFLYASLELGNETRGSGRGENLQRPLYTETHNSDTPTVDLFKNVTIILSKRSIYFNVSAIK
jgi:hypothetical protein